MLRSHSIAEMSAFGFEDVELSFRAWRLGVAIVATPEAVVTHEFRDMELRDENLQEIVRVLLAEASGPVANLQNSRATAGAPDSLEAWHALAYLGRNVHRVGMANSRILDDTGDQVTFRTKGKGQDRKTVDRPGGPSLSA